MPRHPLELCVLCLLSPLRRIGTEHDLPSTLVSSYYAIYYISSVLQRYIYIYIYIHILFLYSGADCPKSGGGMSMMNQSEDCLFLNIWTPLPSNSTASVFEGSQHDRLGYSGLPVMVFFYGGSWQYGSDSFPVYNGQNLLHRSQKDVIVVTLNYRLGPLGFLGSREFASLSSDGSTGNAGLQDQRMALGWVQRNIGNFGGDPNNVLIFGESAGAGSVSAHLLLNKSKGLFHKALMESGPVAAWTAKPMFDAQAQSQQVVAAVQCTDSNSSAQALLSCMQAASVQDLLKAPAGDDLLTWSPVVDGVELTAMPQTLANTHGFASTVPVLFGTNRNEGTEFVSGLDQDGTDEDYLQWILHTFGEDTNETLAKLIYDTYPSASYKSPWWAASFVITDSIMECPARRTAKWLLKHTSDVFLYYFTREIEAVKLFKPTLGVFHASELIFVWDVISYPEDGINIPLPLTKAEKELQQVFVDYWVNFAHYGNPNGPMDSSKDSQIPSLSQTGVKIPGNATFHWPAYTLKSEENIQLDVNLSINTHLNTDLCDFWDTTWWGFYEDIEKM